MSSTSTYRPSTRLPGGGGGGRAGRDVRTGLLATLALVAVVVGVPLALVAFVGNPLPTSLPTREWLTADLTVSAVIDVFAVLLWLAWAHFLVCLAAELAAARRGHGIPGRVPLGGGSQVLARRLVAGVLLLTGAASFAPQTTAPERPAVAVTVTDSTLATAAAVTLAGAVESAPAAAAEQQPAPAQAQKLYEVAPPDGRRHDCLWDIAERTLGDPLRYKEIFELNKDRVQPDGRRLVDADLIHPGWILTMPADAAGPGITTVAAQAPQAPQAAAPAPGLDTAGVQAAARALDGAADELRATHDTSAVGDGEDGRADRGLLGGGLVMAGLLTALSARRGPYRGPQGDVEERVRLAADPATADLLDRGLRTLAATRSGQGLPLPEVALAYACADQLVLHLTGAADAAALSEPPSPWTAGEGGRSWTLRAQDLPAGPAPDVAAPYPALVNVASAHGFELLVDIEAAPGLVALGGDGAAARDVATSMAVELATNVWSDGITVSLVGFGEDLVELAPQSIRQVARLSDVLPQVESDAAHCRALLEALGLEGVLSGRLRRDADRLRPHVLVLSGPPTPEEATRVQQVVGRGRTPVAVVCVGDAPSARWRFAVDGGSIDLGVLGVSGQARTLRPEEYRLVAELARALDASREERSREVAALTPGGALQEFADETAPAGVGPAAVAAGVPVTPDGAAAVEVRLLGPVEVTAPGPVDEQQRAALTEVVVAAALARDGLHDAVLRASVWPRGVSDDVVERTTAAVATWLGRGPDGVARLRLDGDGRWRLAGDVRCDWDVLRHAAAHALDAAELRTVLELGRGEAFSGTAAGRFGWFTFAKAAQQARVLVTTVARRAASLDAAAGRRDLAEQALRQGLALVPTAEPLWRDLLRLAGPEGAPAVAAEMDAVLRRHRVRPEPETDALVEQLVPQRARGPRTA